MKVGCEHTWETCFIHDDPEMYDAEIVGEEIAEENAMLRDCEYCSNCEHHPMNCK